MAKQAEENLDDVIADLVDDHNEDEAGEQSADRQTPFEGIEMPDSPAGDNTVALTNRAARQVEKIISEQQGQDDLYLRVAVEGGGCSGLSYKLGLDYKSEEDEVVESQGVEIIVNPKHMMYLEGITIDYPDGLDARGFTFDNPNATESCGCGTSFAI